MSRPELSLSEEARKALLGANTQNGELPQGTPETVVRELQDAQMIRTVSMTIRGRAARGRLLHDALEEL